MTNREKLAQMSNDELSVQSAIRSTIQRKKLKRRNTMVQIDMQKPDHCLRCPLLNDDDMCCLQDYEGQEEKWDWTWEQQMQNCPLKEVDPLNCTEEES